MIRSDVWSMFTVIREDIQESNNDKKIVEQPDNRLAVNQT